MTSPSLLVNLYNFYLYKFVITSPSESIVDKIDVPTDVEDWDDLVFEDLLLLEEFVSLMSQLLIIPFLKIFLPTRALAQYV